MRRFCYLACLSVLFTLSVAHAMAHETVLRTADVIISPNEVLRMSLDRFYQEYDRRHGLSTEQAYDSAARYYARVKRGMHDRHAGRISAKMLARTQALRRQLNACEN